MAKGRFWFHLLALAVVAVWGVTFVSTKVLLGAGLHPAQIFAIRFSIAYLGIWLLCLHMPQSRRFLSGSLREELIFLLLGVTGGSLYFCTENTALSFTQACNVSFIVCSAPLVTALLTLVVKRRFHGPISEGLEDVSGRWQLLAGSIIALCGMAAVVFDGGSRPSLSGCQMSGDLLALAAAVCWALYSIFMGQMTVRYGSLFATRKVFFYGLLTILPLVSGGSYAGAWPPASVFLRPEVWGNLLFLSLIASLCCFVLWNKVLSRLGNVTATNYVYLNPFFTLVTAMVLLGERLTLQSALGCFAILGGVILGGMRRH